MFAWCSRCTDAAEKLQPLPRHCERNGSRAYARPMTGSATYAPPRKNHLSGKSAKTCPVPRAKIFRFRSHPNHRHNSAVSRRMRGARASSRTRGEMRWTRESRRRVRPDAYGEVVWFGRRGAGVKSWRSDASRDDGGKRAVLREEHEVSRKAIAQGRPECSRCPVCSCAVLFAQIARETAGAASTRSSLRPLFRRRANEDANLGRIVPREREPHIQSSSPAKAGDPVFQRRQ